jgi:hypothetical protein
LNEVKSINWVRSAWTGGIAFLLSLLPWAIGGTRFEWVAAPFWVPGVMAAGVIFQVSLHDSGWYILPLVGALNFIFVWIVLLVIVNLFQKWKNREA